jgi:signal peptidase I
MAIIKYKIVSDSMTPLIPIGAEIFLEKIGEDRELKRFDIVVFEQNKQLTCHYIWHQNKNFDKGMTFTRSLKYNAEDDPFDQDKILGIVTNYKIGFFTKIKILIRDKIT